MLLVEFVVRHTDFQYAELQSILQVCDVPYTILDLPLASAAKTLRPSSHRSFCLFKLNDSTAEESVAATILNRCTLVRSVIRSWGLGTTLEACAEAAVRWRNAQAMVEGAPDYEKMTWSLTIQTVGAKFTREEQNLMRKPFGELNLGQVCLDNPELDLRLIREVELDLHGNTLYPQRSPNGEVLRPEGPPALAYFFGSVIHATENRRPLLFSLQSLKQRKYLGPTSMDAELSNIMANLAQIKQGSLVLDPFCGTGSILLSCALLGAHCIGMDIDIRVLRGADKNESVASNFLQFGLPVPDLVRADNHLFFRHWRHASANLYDAIVCDPPYGIRAGARKSGSRRQVVAQVKPEFRKDHIAQTQPYPVADVMTDLLNTAAEILRLGGHLVYILPSVATEFDVEMDLPVHPCLQTAFVCFQPLSTEYGRRIVALRKTKDNDPALPSMWKDPNAAEKCANIREKIMEAAKLKPEYAQKAAIRKQKRKNRKEAEKLTKRRAMPDTDTNTR